MTNPPRRQLGTGGGHDPRWMFNPVNRFPAAPPANATNLRRPWAFVGDPGDPVAGAAAADQSWRRLVNDNRRWTIEAANHWPQC